MNLSVVENQLTAKTNLASAQARAENLAALGVQGTITELCVGPSLRILEAEYEKYGLSCVGNDIDRRWQFYYPGGAWRIGDCFKVKWDETVVFAPPLSHGCTGRREDSLQVREVSPSYVDFLKEVKNRNFCGNAVLVLPGRAWKNDRAGLYSVLNRANELGKAEAIPLYDARHRVVKYVDIYLRT